jgi:hypothetical protein
MGEHSDVSRRKVLQGVTGGAVVASLPGMVGIASSAESIRIGMPAALTGPSGGIGAQMRL